MQSFAYLERSPFSHTKKRDFHIFKEKSLLKIFGFFYFRSTNSAKFSKYNFVKLLDYNVIISITGTALGHWSVQWMNLGKCPYWDSEQGYENTGDCDKKVRPI